jgi:hypothetical protein
MIGTHSLLGWGWVLVVLQLFTGHEVADKDLGLDGGGASARLPPHHWLVGGGAAGTFARWRRLDAYGPTLCPSGRRGHLCSLLDLGLFSDTSSLRSDDGGAVCPSVQLGSTTLSRSSLDAGVRHCVRLVLILFVGRRSWLNGVRDRL